MQRDRNESATMTATILIGLQASGKSTFCLQNFADNHVLISMDILKSRSREKERIMECISLKKSFIVDNTNVTKNERARYIEAAISGGYRVSGYLFTTTVKDAVVRNRQREALKRVPDIAIFSVANRFNQPAKEEGFDELYSVKFDGAGGFIVKSMNR